MPGLDKTGSLRDNIVARICRRLKSSFGSLPSDVQNFITMEVTEMLASGAISPKDILRVAHEAKKLLPKSSPRRAEPVEEPSHLDSEGAKPEVRRTVANRIDRMERESRWVEMLKEDAENLEKEKLKQKVAKQQRIADQKHVLEQQIEQQQRKKEKEREEDIRLQKMVEEKSRIEEERDRDKERAQKAKVTAERAGIEHYMKARLQEKAAEQHAHQQEEREYLKKIIAEEQQKKELEARKKIEARKQLKESLQANVLLENERRAIAKLEAQRNAQLLNEGMNAAFSHSPPEKKLQGRGADKGLGVKQQLVFEEYLHHKQISDEQKRKHDEYLALVLKETELREDQEDLEKKQKRRQLRSELVQSLESQISEKEMGKKQVDMKNHEFRQTVDNSFNYGYESEHRLKMQEKERKREMMITLERQIAEKRIRDRQELPIKI